LASGPTPPIPKQLASGPTPPTPKQLASGPTPPTPKQLASGPTPPTRKQLASGPTPKQLASGPADDFDRQFGKLERGELAHEQGAMLGDLMHHGQRQEALAQLRQQIGQLSTRPGRTPDGTAVNPRPGHQSAHTAPQSTLRNQPQYNPHEMITRFLPTGRGHPHTVFDQAWQREYDAIFRQTGRTTTTAKELEEVVGRAARTSGAFSAAEGESVAQLIKNDLYFQLGLSSDTVLRMPGH